MVFKLVRVDTHEPCKIKLPIGTNLIGRGNLLSCDDKRISRNHGELDVTEDSVTIKSLHSNPCFITKKNSNTDILKKDCSVALSNGDKFGLLPDTYWYELLHCTDSDIESEIPTEESANTNNESTNEENNTELNVTKNTSDSDTRSHHSDSTPVNFEMNNPQSNAEGRAVSSFMIFPSNEDSDMGQQSETAKGSSTPSKRSNTTPHSSPVDIKRVKTEPEAVGNAQPGPSSEQNRDSGDSRVKDEPSSSPPKPNRALRERCMYGAECYRRNPQHAAQFSHPRDADWDACGTCVHGAACRRTDPRHWATHTHPPGAAPPAAPRPGKKQKRKRQDVSYDTDSDEVSTPGLIVTGKRARKQVVRQNIDTSSESQDDPFGTDESDEWQPSTDFSTQNYSQDD